jgi:seryl-tRNA synthetase
MEGPVQAASAEQEELLHELVAAGHLIESGVPGVYGHSAAFEDVRSGLMRWLTAAGAAEGAERLSFPPVIPRRQIESNNYLASFPHLAGTVFAFEGEERAAREQAQRAAAHEDWSEFQTMSELSMKPAACYPVYPAIAARGPVPEGGVVIDTGGAWVFRHEPSLDPARRQIFQMHELVRIGEPETVQAWRDGWIDRALAYLRSLGLDVEPDVANDPFFGRQGRMLAANQRQEQLKVELQVQIAGPEPTAVASFNCHRDHFATNYGLQMHDGGAAHTGCLGFGGERIILALFRTHGMDPDTWPAQVTAELAADDGR